MTLEEFITRSNGSASREEVFALFQQALKHLGYDSVPLSHLERHVALQRARGCDDLDPAAGRSDWHGSRDFGR
jgi:hypothetical protein